MRCVIFPIKRLLLIDGFCLCLVTRIAVGSYCLPGDVCSDDNAVCSGNTCSCRSGYHLSQTRCGGCRPSNAHSLPRYLVHANLVVLSSNTKVRSGRWPCGTVPDLRPRAARGRVSRVRIPPAAAVYQRQLSVPSLRGRLMSTSESWGVNGHITRCTGPVTVVLRPRLVSG